ncbi:aminotransferase class I/II-fold pyridoxal phosphate-dependent enzyme [Streptomyces sp. N35]|uniref:aminotransferase class I/II-fold pyridoxal phosphate-dependent enzyme n=1 Tax=Streptomyces sp. N35 TaxID=2795730 RepID=UPI0018F4DCEE|nr:aminotransferase class I/II-fold pyridoxal phosphate-dependent enzyme [Streptomyces sp. N35]
MPLDHTQAPVLQALAAYRDHHELGFTPPGHKQARGADPEARAVLGDAVYLGDVLASGGLDDRRMRGQVLQRAEHLMADAVHAEHTFFSTCGSSLSVKAAMLTVAAPHDSLLISRDAHKSVVAGLILAGIEPVWLEPRWDPERHLAHPPSAATVAKAFADHPEARGALVTSPTPYGTTADLSAIAAVCHRQGRPLIVDEAWGAHLPFHPDLPAWAMDAGADVCVTSIHKMGSGLEQGSVFHLQGDLVDPAALASRADLLGTTSPSVLLYAGIDAWRRQMALHGRELLGAALELAHTTRQSIDALDGLRVDRREDYCGPGRADGFDPLPVVVDVTGLGLTGYRAADWLRARHHIDVHLADHRCVSAQLTHADDHDTTGRLLTALRDLVHRAPSLLPVRQVRVPQPAELRLVQELLPRDAYFGPAEDVPAEQAAGRVVAEMLTPYPPGIPVVLPGERLTDVVLTYLRTGIEAGMNVPDAADPALRTIRVVAER